jgi:beta-lactamase superfamily II metal-dependent hydrolase
MRLAKVADLVSAAGLDFSKVRLVQVPHHGSRRNVGPSILDRILGPKVSKGTILRNAMVSVAKDADSKHPSKRVTNAFLRRGAPVTRTQGGTIRFGADAPDRGWDTVEPLPFFDEVEEE